MITAYDREKKLVDEFRNIYGKVPSVLELQQYTANRAKPLKLSETLRGKFTDPNWIFFKKAKKTKE